ncbi:MAG: carboxypeptidase-like regulatory domain-containing protein [Cyclobacteriaceae bacterium]|nr:carboxypeptidase-like regulatory domain-containing protein [Cyclobacteriaceae bacterium]
MRIHRSYVLILLAAGILLCSTEARAQSNRRQIIQLSGIVLGEDSVSGLPGVHVYVPKAGRGTSTNITGFFSMPVLAGDSVVISSVGYIRQHYIVPPSMNEDFLTIVVEMTTDNTFLTAVTILPFPTEEVFKQAVLALNVPFDDKIDRRNLNAELMALMMRTTPMDGNLNYRYYMEQYNTSITDRSMGRTNPFLNPFNWARFFRDLKKKK